jgi:hypothetical protein
MIAFKSIFFVQCARHYINHMASTWRSRATQFIASGSYASLEPLDQFNAITRLAAFMVASVLALDHRPFAESPEHCNVLTRAFYLLAPQARESTDGTDGALCKQAIMLGVRQYVNNYVVAEHPIGTLLDRASKVLTEAMDSTDRIPGQGVKDSLGVDVKTLIRHISHQYNQIDECWNGRLSTWRKIPLPRYVALSPDDKAKVDYLLSRPDATDFCFDDRVTTHIAILRRDKQQLDQALETRRDVSAAMQIEQAALNQIEAHLSEAQVACQAQEEKLEDLERQFYTAREVHTQTLRRCKQWEDAKAPAQARLARQKEQLTDLEKKLGKYATNVFDQDAVLRCEMYQQSLV